MATEHSPDDLAMNHQSRIQHFETDIEFKHSATNPLIRAVGSIATGLRACINKYAESKQAVPPTIEPMWMGPIHFHMRSAEATLPLQTKVVTSEQIIDVVTGQSDIPDPDDRPLS